MSKQFWTLNSKGEEVLRDLEKEHENFSIEKYNSGEFDGNNFIWYEMFDMYLMESNGCDYERKGCYIKEGDVVVDIGANIDDWNQLVLETYPYANIHLFEVDLRIHKRLKTELEGRFPKEQLHINNLAVTYSPEDKTVFHYCEKQNWILFNRHFDLEKQYNLLPPIKNTIASTTIDLYCQENNVKFINFLRIGITDSILSVLDGSEKMLMSDRIDFIQFKHESSLEESPASIKQLFNHLKQSKYFLLKIDQDNLIYMEGLIDVLKNQDSYFLAVNDRFKSLILGQSPEMLLPSCFKITYAAKP